MSEPTPAKGVPGRVRSPRRWRSGAGPEGSSVQPFFALSVLLGTWLVIGGWWGGRTTDHCDRRLERRSTGRPPPRYRARLQRGEGRVTGIYKVIRCALCQHLKRKECVNEARPRMLRSGGRPPPGRQRATSDRRDQAAGLSPACAWPKQRNPRTLCPQERATHVRAPNHVRALCKGMRTALYEKLKRNNSVYS